MKPLFHCLWLFALLGIFRYLDGFIGLYLRQGSGEPFPSALARNWRGTEAAATTVQSIGLGLFLFLGLAVVLAMMSRQPLRQQAEASFRALLPFVLFIGLTVVAAISLFVSGEFPFGLNLPLTLAYEGAFASLLVWSLFAVSVAQVASQAWRRRFPAPPGPPVWANKIRDAALLVSALALFLMATPSRFWQEGVGEGNTFKYVRMASALAHSATLDIGTSRPSTREATPGEFARHVPQAVWQGVREAGMLLGRVLGGARNGTVYTGEVRATRANRAMFQSPAGGIYYINAPGPGFLLLPAYLLDGLLNRWLDSGRQVAMIAFWCFLGSLLVLQMARLAHELVGHWTLCALAALALALSPPFLFYTFQVYPELPAALGILYVFRKLIVGQNLAGARLLAVSLIVAYLPWLHQKYSITATLFAVYAVYRIYTTRSSLRQAGSRLAIFVGPLALSAFSIAVYNHALTGSWLPQATFVAAGRSSFEPQNLLRGLLGLHLDVENGLFVYAPIYVVALLGLATFYAEHRRVFLLWLATVASYLFVIASFPHWPGAVSTVCRYMLSVAPLAIVPIARVAVAARTDGFLAGIFLALLAASFSVSLSFHEDLVPSLQPYLFLERRLYSDPYQYLPDFLTPGIVGSGPSHGLKLIFLGLLLGGLTLFCSRRVGPTSSKNIRPRFRVFSLQATTAGAALVLSLVVAGAALERMPDNRSHKQGPVFRDSEPMDSAGAIQLVARGGVGFEGQGVWVPGGGETRFLIQSKTAIHRLRLTLSNGPRPNRIRITQPGVSVDRELGPDAQETFNLLPRDPYRFRGPRGEAWLYSVDVRSRAGFVPRREGRGQDSRHLGCHVRFDVR